MSVLPGSPKTVTGLNPFSVALNSQGGLTKSNLNIMKLPFPPLCVRHPDRDV